MMTRAGRDRDELERSPEAVEAGNVLPFRPRTSVSVSPPEPTADDLGATPDDFRHRMLVNAAGLACAVTLTAAGIWLASSLSNLRQAQDCVLTGQRGCAAVPVIDKQSLPLRQH